MICKETFKKEVIKELAELRKIGAAPFGVIESIAMGKHTEELDDLSEYCSVSDAADSVIETFLVMDGY